ncbi:MAG: M12 family metallopeptidase [Cyanobacteria bacterium P01_F01_bin.86]
MGIIISDTKYRWSDGIVPYEINGDDFPEDSTNRATIQAAIDHWNQNTQIHLSPRNNEKDYVRFVAANESCSSAVGRQGGRQTIGCDLSNFGTGSIIHEIGHAVGLFHEHSRQKRDNYITVHFDNIIDDKEHNFEEKKPDEAYNVGPYDYGSIMHYGEISTNFAEDPNKNTITAPKPIGQRTALSKVDIVSIEEVYSLPHERFFATFRKSNRSEIQVYKWKYQDFRAKYDELWPQGWRLWDLQPYVINDQVRYNAVWYKSRSSIGEIQIYGWKYQDFRAKYDELWPQGWRLHILKNYVIKNQVFYTAVWRRSKRAEIQVYDWKDQDLRAKANELWPQGWRLRIVNPYVVNGQVLYSAVWYRSNRGDIQAFGWKPEDFRKKNGKLRRKGWRLHLFQPYLQGQELRYTATWRYLPSRSDRQTLDLPYARYRAYYDKIFSQGWRLHRLTVM